MNQPTSTPISAELSAAQEAARNNVDLLVAESQRFERLIASQKRELASLDGALTDMKQQVVKATDSHDVLIAKSKELEKKVASLTHDINVLSNVIEATKAERDDREDILTYREESILVKEIKLQEEVDALRERSKAIEAEEFIINEKKGLISELITKL